MKRRARSIHQHRSERDFRPCCGIWQPHLQAALNRWHAALDLCGSGSESDRPPLVNDFIAQHAALEHLVDVIGNPKLYRQGLATESRQAIRPQGYGNRRQNIPQSEPSLFGNSFHIHDGLHPSSRPGVDEEVDGKSIHAREAAEGFCHEARNPVLVPLAGLDPLVAGSRSGIPEIVEIHRLGLGNHGRRPFRLRGCGQPRSGVARRHDFARVESLRSEFPAPEVPTRLHRHPSPVVQTAEIYAVADIPTAVAVVILHALGHRRVVVAIHTLDDAVGVFAADGLRGHIEKKLHVIAEHEPVRLGAGGGKRLINEGNEHIAGMRAHKALHGCSLPHTFMELIAANGAEQREIGLKHKPQAVAGLVNLALNGVLGEPQKIQISQLREKDVVMKLGDVAPENTQVEIAHRIRSTETDFAPVEAEFSFGSRVFILLKAAHAKLAACGIKHHAPGIEQLDLRLIQPRCFKIPESGICHGEREREIVFSRPHESRFRLRRAVVEIAKSPHPLASGAVQVTLVDAGLEVAAEDRDAQDRLLRGEGARVLHLGMNLDGVQRGKRAQKQIRDREAGAGLKTHTLPDAHAGRAMVPPLLGIVVAEAGCGVDFIAIRITIRKSLAEHGEIVLHTHEEDISVAARDACDIKFKGLKKTLVRAETNAVEIDLASIVHRIKTKHLPLLGEDFQRHVDACSIQRRRWSKRRSVMGNPHILPHTNAAFDRLEIRPVR